MLTQENQNTRRIGGSSSAAVLGQSKYRTQLDEYYRMLGNPQEDIDNVHTKFGNLAESIIAEIYCERYNKYLFRHGDAYIEDWHNHHISYTNENETGPYIHNEYDFITLNPDFESEEEDGYWFNEIKTADIFVKNQFGLAGTDYVPEEYNLQCHHYFFFNRYQRGRLIVVFVPYEIKEMCVNIDFDHDQLKEIISRYEMRIYEFFKDHDYLKNMLNGYLKFMWHVNNQIEPEPKDFDEFCRTVKPVSGKEKMIDDDGLAIIGELENIRIDKQIIEQREELAKAQLAIYLNDAEVLLSDTEKDKKGNPKKLYTFKEQFGRTFDADKFTEDNPELAIKYSKLGIDTKTLKSEMPQVYEKYQDMNRVLRRCK